MKRRTVVLVAVVVAVLGFSLFFFVTPVQPAVKMGLCGIPCSRYYDGSLSCGILGVGVVYMHGPFSYWDHGNLQFGCKSGAS